MSDEQFEKLIAKLDSIESTIKAATVITMTMPEVCQHEYPSVWHGTVPPRCSKCGKAALMFQPTYTTSNGID